MSGHSKWANIRAKKGKSDAAREKIFTKIGREISVAVKAGGPDPNTNSKLYDAIQKAKSNNMPKSNIESSIAKAAGSKNSESYENCLYEGYAAGGIAVLVECLTDNKNRTGGEMRHLFDKYGNSMGQSGCVSYLFDRKGIITIEAKPEMSEDDMMMKALDAGADDFISDGDVFVVYTKAEELSSVAKNLTAANIEYMSAEINWIPQSLTDVDPDVARKVQNLVDQLEDNDDVQNVYHNANLPEEE